MVTTPTVPVVAKGKTDTGRIWTYVVTTGPLGRCTPAALFHYSRDRGAEHPQRHLAGWSGLLQADAYAGYNALYQPDRPPKPSPGSCAGAMRAEILRARRHRRERAAWAGCTPISPLALEAVKRIDRLFDIERTINGLSINERLAIAKHCRHRSSPRLEGWMRAESCDACPSMPKSPGP